ncbi:MAG: holo-ACP synthase, partial [Hyphomonas sp.]|uniref:holo-ACP synthase n=1 Tax=Hyphomonas sp. TaxID=87 RepID=UPI003299E1AC
MIVGIGADLCRVSRIEHSLRRFGDSFAQTFCSPREFEYAKAQSNPAVAFALCFATKEAFAKAAGTGFNADLWWDDVETVFNHDGR